MCRHRRFRRRRRHLVVVVSFRGVRCSVVGLVVVVVAMGSWMVLVARVCCLHT